MAYILHIETTSTVCSVAISKNTELVALKELDNGYTHAENLHLFIESILSEASLKPSDLQTVSVSSGPGSYTGLRIGYSAAKGLAYALKIPLISVDTLKALSVLAIKQSQIDGLYCPMMDARRMEVYSAVYNQQLQTVLPVQPIVLTEESISIFKLNKPLFLFGDGVPKAKTLLQTLPDVFFIDNIKASALGMIDIAFEKYKAQQFEDVAYSEPNYLKEFFFTSAKK